MALERQILEILNRDELAQAGIVPNADSFGAALTYLAQHSGFRPPSLGLRQDGTFALSWRPQGRARLNVEFLGRASVRVICVDARPDQSTPLKGTFELSAKRLDAFLMATGCDGWLK